MPIDENQKIAVMHRDGPMMVLAGPGSGKTTVITNRICYLIRECQIPPAQILVITFTRAAADEMRVRFEQQMDRQKVPVIFGTFHSVYFNILRAAYGYRASDILREETKYSFVREYIYRNSFEFDDENELIRNLISEISLVKNSGIDLNHYYSVSCSYDKFRKFFETYQEFLDRSHQLDFDDMLIRCAELLRERPDIRAAWQKRFRYILIDEFQDINLIQYQVIKMLAAPENNLFIVGDDDQSIYRFRGAKPEIMAQFLKDYPDAGRAELGANYRCGGQIVRLSRNLISHNSKRFPKDLVCGTDKKDEIVRREFPDQRSQNVYIIGEIRKLINHGTAPEKIAILARTNMQLMYLLEQLSAYNIPFVSRESVPSLYRHWIAADILTYIRIACGSRARQDLLKIMNRPNRYLSRDSLGSSTVDFSAWARWYKNQQWVVKRIQRLENDLSVIAGMRPYAAVIYIRKAVCYDDFLKEYAAAHGIDPDELFEILDEVTERSKDYDSFAGWFDQIEQTELAQKQQAERRKAAADNCIVVSTYHSSKGLEFDAVFLPDLNEKVIPNKKAVLEDDLEEERRMFYVAMTRAKEKLYLLWPKKTRNKEMEPSRYLAELRAEMVRDKTSDREKAGKRF